VGKPEGEATSILIAAKLQTAVVVEFSATVPIGNVISQEPPQGTQIRQGSAVTLHVSKGPRRFPMPKVIGMSEPAAKALLEQLGLIVREIRIPGSGGNDVVGQSPLQGAIVEQGTTVTIYVA